VSFYGTNLQERVLQERKHDDKFQQLKHRLEHGTCGEDVDYHLMADDLVRCRDRIYVPYDSELKNIISREFNV